MTTTKTALITGASRGLGQQFGRELEWNTGLRLRRDREAAKLDHIVGENSSCG